MQKKFVKKVISLPSGGIEYPPLSYLYPLDIYFVLSRFSNLGIGDFETAVGIIKHYVDTPVDIEEMYVQDIYYLWAYMLMTQITKSDIVDMHMSCRKCNESNKVFVSLSSLEMNMYHKYDNSFAKEKTIMTHWKSEISFGHRKVLHNYVTANLNIKNDTYNKKNFYKVLINFCLPQISKIIIDDEIIPEVNWKEYLSSLLFRDIIKLYAQMNEFTKSIGIYDQFEFACKKCGHISRGWIYEDLAACRNNIASISDYTYLIEEILKNSLEEARFPVYTLDDIMNRPLIYTENYGAAFKKISFKVGQVIS